MSQIMTTVPLPSYSQIQNLIQQEESRRSIMGGPQIKKFEEHKACGLAVKPPNFFLIGSTSVCGPINTSPYIGRLDFIPGESSSGRSTHPFSSGRSVNESGGAYDSGDQMQHVLEQLYVLLGNQNTPQHMWYCL